MQPGLFYNHLKSVGLADCLQITEELKEINYEA
jgi:hypothetical protein